MKQFNKDKELRKIKFQKNKNTYIKRLSISLSCLILLFVVILFTFARFETSSDEYTLINGNVVNICNYEVGYEWFFNYTGDVQNFKVPCNGNYKIELWGADGGDAKTTTAATNSNFSGGKCAYTSGNINLTRKSNLFIQVGGAGTDSVWNINLGVVDGGYNGGGPTKGQYTENKRCWGTGGGATDIRLISGTINSFNSLKSRIMVAAGGGGAFAEGTMGDNGGAGGGLNGYGGTSNGYSLYGISYGATQTTAGYMTNYLGSNNSMNPSTKYYSKFGYATSTMSPCSAGGGGGYYGGANSGHVNSASSGSSFISGYSRCNAIAESSTESNIVHTNQTNHYSGKVFTNGVMIDGKGCNWSTGSAANCGANQIQPYGSKAVGHTGDGYARIKLVSTTDKIKITCEEIVGRSWDFYYNGNDGTDGSIQEFSVPCNGVYKLETWGAQGGNYNEGNKVNGGMGGYSKGEVSLNNNDKLYIGIGGKGEDPTFGVNYARGGYNGGGAGSNVEEFSNYNWTLGGAGGGGATHISINNNLGTLSNYSSNINDLLIVSGGGGGAGANSGSSAKTYYPGGTGGGTTGGNGSATKLSNYSSIHRGTGGTQSAGGKSDGYESALRTGGFGFGGSNGATGAANQAAGGGSGYYGGGAGQNYGASGGGGSGYLSSLLANSSMSNGVRTGNGYARITYISTN